MDKPILQHSNTPILQLFAPAKINWSLKILNRRGDGYHDIISLMQRISLCDVLTFQRSDRLEISADVSIPMKDNLIYKAAMLLKKEAGFNAGARITLRKEIPMAAGLGGGSSDAAAALTGLSRLWDLDIDRDRLERIGGAVGSDVPFFFGGPASVVEGKGEIVSPFKVDRSYLMLVVKPPLDVSTAWAYAELDKGLSQLGSPQELTKRRDVIKLFSHAFETGDFSLLSSIQSNDFDVPVAGRYPVINEIRRCLAGKGALFCAMSGSGPTVFGVFDSESRAREAMDYVQPNWCRIVRTVTQNE